MTALVVMPTYNEAANLPRVVAEVLAHPGVGLLVVDDGSPDGTGQIADALAASSGGRLEVLHRIGVRGLGLSYIDGLRRALASGVPVICQMDADLSHDPKYLPALIAALDHSDLAIGARYCPGGGVANWPWHRVLLSRFANSYIRAITGLAPSDCTGAYRAWRRDALLRLPLDAPRTGGYAFLTEMLYDAARLGCRIGQVPIVFVERREGHSKVSRSVLVESLLTPWRLIARHGRLSTPRP